MSSCIGLKYAVNNDHDEDDDDLEIEDDYVNSCWFSISLDTPTSRFFAKHEAGTNFVSLYGTRIRPVPPFGSLSSKPPAVDPALIHQVLSDDLLFEVFIRLPPYALGCAGCVCRKWRYATRNPVLWQKACLSTWQMFGVEENFSMLQSFYGGSWRNMWISRPRLRCDGIFVSRNTYLRTGVAEWRVTNPVHLVCYYRYIKFYPSGKFLYKVSPHKLKEVAKSLQGKGSKVDGVYEGRYTLNHNQVEATTFYPGLRTVVRIRMRVRSTIQGANNRLDLLALVTSGIQETELKGHEEEVLEAVEGWQENESHNPDVPAVSHRRGLAPFVFVPFHQVETSDLNLPVEKMDYFVPG
ncbi:hypothetical protein GOP47_0004285 [Adiantum capillus-veneris]|uniref:F-box domain-containing protein n=1 Tax=Adiantum capillus-veneris TaxID=13818 RepID=A0A9D4V901_ADICA|nr:hypothetical protein GOP47_0004285 [Adiantum capillus-veneris]